METIETVQKEISVYAPKFSGFGEFLGYYPLWKRRSRKKSGLLILIRHGRSVLNEHKRLQPWTPDGDVLSPSGFIQSQLLARILRFIDIQTIYTSDFVRTEDTANLILQHQIRKKGLEIRKDVALRDFNFGKLSGLSVDLQHHEVAEKYPQIYDLFLNHREQYYAPEGDTTSDYVSRASARAEEIATDSIGKVTAVVSHEMWIKSVLYWAWKRPLSELNAMKIRNASISIVEYDRQSHSFQVLVANDVAHLS